MQVSFEAPPGVKRNLQRTYDAWDNNLICQAPPLQAQLLFMLAWFHAIVQERRAYMPQASLLLHGLAMNNFVMVVTPPGLSCVDSKMSHTLQVRCKTHGSLLWEAMFAMQGTAQVPAQLQAACNGALCRRHQGLYMLRMLLNWRHCCIWHSAYHAASTLWPQWVTLLQSHWTQILPQQSLACIAGLGQLL